MSSGYQSPIQILCVEREVERVRLQAVLNEFPDLVLAGEASSSSETLRCLHEKSIDVVVIDLGLPNTDGIELTKQIRESHPSVRVLIFTASDEPNHIFHAMNAGADGYVLKGSVSKAVEMAIRSVRLGAVWLDPGIARQVLQITEEASPSQYSRTLPTGLLTIPLYSHDKSILKEVAASDCQDGVCLVDPSFVRKLRRFAPS